jgi:GntR family transcriptional regulator
MGTKHSIPVLKRVPLPIQVAQDLLSRLAADEWAREEQLPTEAELVDYYQVSRATVRQALKSLESQGAIVIRPGRGSFVSPGSMIRAGMQDLTSMTATIREMGHVPETVYHHRTWRQATPEEAEEFDLTEDLTILEVQRKLLADGLAVCYSYDLLPRWVFPAGFKPEDLNGSIFEYFSRNRGPVPQRAVAKVHPAANPAVVWDEKFPPDQLFLQLDQMHYDELGHPFMHTTAYFIDGRFDYTVVRTVRTT